VPAGKAKLCLAAMSKVACRCGGETRDPPGVLHPALEPSAQDRPGPVGSRSQEAAAMM